MPKLKKLAKENKLLTKEIKKLKEHFATDKNLRTMKMEAIECFDDCKKILVLLEGLVQQKMLTEIVGQGGKAKIEVNSPPIPMSNELSLMTMHDFEDNFIKEITEQVK